MKNQMLKIVLLALVCGVSFPLKADLYVTKFENLNVQINQIRVSPIPTENIANSDRRIDIVCESNLVRLRLEGKSASGTNFLKDVDSFVKVYFDIDKATDTKSISMLSMQLCRVDNLLYVFAGGEAGITSKRQFREIGLIKSDSSVHLYPGFHAKLALIRTEGDFNPEYIDDKRDHNAEIERAHKTNPIGSASLHFVGLDRTTIWPTR